MKSQNPIPTPERLLAAAEQLFAEVGYQAVSLRSITRRVGINIAAVHYHFGSKQDLLEEIFSRRCGPMNQERLRLLTLCRDDGDRPPMLEQVLEAYVRPSLVWPGDPEGARRFLRLRAMLAHEDAKLSRDLIARHFNAVSRTFLGTMRDLLPQLGGDELYWRFHFLLGAHYYTLSDPGRIAILSEGRVDPSHAERSVRYLVPFLAAGFRAPPAQDRLVFADESEFAGLATA